MKYFLTTTIIFITTLTFAQLDTKKVKIKKEYYTETYYVLKNDTSIRHGLYLKTAFGKTVCSGQYTNGKQTGVWNLNSDNETGDIIYNFDKEEVISGKSRYKDTCKLYDRPPIWLINEEFSYRLLANVIRYPQYAKENGLMGTVILSISIDSCGKPTKFEIFKSVEKSVDDEAMRVLKIISLNTEWIPARKGGKNVDSIFYFPIKFTLE